MISRLPKRFSIVIAAVFAAATLSACQDMRKGPYGEIFEWADEPGWIEYTILKHGWARAHPKTPPQIYCYRTLADADCYEVPQPHMEERLIGEFAGPVTQ